ncbi:MAG: methylmalonyl Co-A mutase-associated GTPase MeaB, partial [Alphaproteobacteria bacterium]|nr:methylmalonyl Co-A mutase-associated GTPase MeaB [Alphaproteobacteria bacterium]
IIETVGVGQDEVEIVRVADTTVVVSAPGLGDDIQAIKAGVLEIADIHMVSKGDRQDADKTVAELKQMLMLGELKQEGWAVPVLATSALTGHGINELLGLIDAHRTHLQDSGTLAARRRRSAETRTLKIAEGIIRGRYAAGRGAEAQAIIDRVSARKLDPHGAALALLDILNQGNTA